MPTHEELACLFTEAEQTYQAMTENRARLVELYTILAGCRRGETLNADQYARYLALVEKHRHSAREALLRISAGAEL